MSATSSCRTFMATEVDLWKLIWRPVASEKSSKMVLRIAIEAGFPLVIIRVSSAYCKTGHAREGSIG
jgi:hypothetical protein